MEMCGFLEGVKREKNSIVDTHVCKEGQKDLADSYEEKVSKALEIAVSKMPIRGSSGKINSDYKLFNWIKAAREIWGHKS